MADTYHDIVFKLKTDADGIATGNMQMLVYVKNDLTDPLPDAPDFGEDFTLDDTTEERQGDYIRGIRTTVFAFDFDSTWEPWSDTVPDASLPYTPPDNLYTFEYKDKRAAFQGKTIIVWFIEREAE